MPNIIETENDKKDNSLEIIILRILKFSSIALGLIALFILIFGILTK